MSTEGGPGAALLKHLKFIGWLRAAPRERRCGVEPARSLRLRERAQEIAAAIAAADRSRR